MTLRHLINNNIAIIVSDSNESRDITEKQMHETGERKAKNTQTGRQTDKNEHDDKRRWFAGNRRKGDNSSQAWTLELVEIVSLVQ